MSASLDENRRQLFDYIIFLKRFNAEALLGIINLITRFTTPEYVKSQMALFHYPRTTSKKKLYDVIMFMREFTDYELLIILYLISSTNLSIDELQVEITDLTFSKVAP